MLRVTDPSILPAPIFSLSQAELGTVKRGSIGSKFEAMTGARRSRGFIQGYAGTSGVQGFE